MDEKQKLFENEIYSIKESKQITEANKQIILDFVGFKQGQGIGNNRLNRILISMKGFANGLKYPLSGLDNKMRHRIYIYVMKHAGFNPHLLRHARLSSLAHSKKPEHQEKDRMMLVKSIADFKKLESAEAYLRNMTDAEKLEVF